MKSKTFEVKKAGGDSWEFTIHEYPETWEEAKQKFGEQGAFDIFESALDVRYQNAGRDKFDRGLSREEVEDVVNNYQPGGGRSSKKQRALDLIVEKAAEVAGDPQLKTDVNTAFKSGDWDTVINLLETE